MSTLADICQTFSENLSPSLELGKGAYGTVYGNVKQPRYIAKLYKNTEKFDRAVRNLEGFTQKSDCPGPKTVCQSLVESFKCPDVPQPIIVQAPRGQVWPAFLRTLSSTQLQVLQAQVWNTMRYLLFERSLLLTDFKAENTIYADGRLVFIDLEDYITFENGSWVQGEGSLIQTPFLGVPVDCLPGSVPAPACCVWGMLLALHVMIQYLGAWNDQSPTSKTNWDVLSPTMQQAWIQNSTRAVRRRGREQGMDAKASFQKLSTALRLYRAWNDMVMNFSARDEEELLRALKRRRRHYEKDIKMLDPSGVLFLVSGFKINEPQDTPTLNPATEELKAATRGFYAELDFSTEKGQSGVWDDQQNVLVLQDSILIWAFEGIEALEEKMVRFLDLRCGSVPAS